VVRQPRVACARMGREMGDRRSRSHGGVVKRPDNKDVSNIQSMRRRRRGLSQLEEMVRPSPTVMMEFQVSTSRLGLCYMVVKVKGFPSCLRSVLTCKWAASTPRGASRELGLR